MSTAATERVDLGPLDDFADEEGTLVEVAGRRISLIRLGDDVYAIGDTCRNAAFAEFARCRRPTCHRPTCHRHHA